ncbi:MAG TPA: M48 family metallopeptidase [Terriglobales bacterium]|jgi:Zn-dependent protease with chaperone function
MARTLNLPEMDLSLAAKGFVLWLAPQAVDFSPTGNIPVLSPDDLACLRSEGWLTNNEILTIYAYSRAAAVVQTPLLPKVRAFRLRADIPEQFEHICASSFPAAIREVGDSLTLSDLFRRPPAPVAKALAEAFSAYRSQNGQLKPKRLSGLRSVVFEHPSDRNALSVLKAAPGIGTVTRKLVDFFKKSDEVAALGNAMRVTPQSMPAIHKVLAEACEVLGVAPIPRLYVKFGQLESYTLGAEVPHIILASIAVSLLTREELLFVLGHELGHIKAGHVPYHTLAKAMKDAAAVASTITLGLAGLAFDATLSPLLGAWSRRSEYTADRAGYLACQDQEVTLRALMKLAGYPPLLYGRMHTRSIVAQAHDFRAMLSDHAAERFFNVSNLWDSSHANIVSRVYELIQWLQEGTGNDILRMSAVELQRYADVIDVDPTLAELQQKVTGMVADWAFENCSVYRSTARRLVRGMICGLASAKNTELQHILQIQFTLKKLHADEFEHWIYLLVNQDGKPTRVKFPVAWDTSWDALPTSFRVEFIRCGKPEMSWNLYTVK